jgi:hypothetical protein
MKYPGALLIAVVFIIGTALTGYPMHVDVKGTVKGQITKVEITEYTITVKDAKGNETKMKVKSLEDLEVGDDVVITEGEMKKAVKPITGGYK